MGVVFTNPPSSGDLPLVFVDLVMDIDNMCYGSDNYGIAKGYLDGIR